MDIPLPESAVTKEHTQGELLLRVGAWQSLELRIGITSYAVTRSPSGNSSGINDGLLGVKIKLVEGSGGFGLDRPDVALIVTTTLPTGGYNRNRLGSLKALCTDVKLELCLRQRGRRSGLANSPVVSRSAIH